MYSECVRQASGTTYVHSAPVGPCMHACLSYAELLTVSSSINGPLKNRNKIGEIGNL